MSGRLAAGEYHGSIVRSLSGPGVTVTETRHPAERKVKTHNHERPYLCYVLHGGFLERSGREERACERGALIVHPAGETHSDVFGGEGALCLNVELEPELFKVGNRVIRDRIAFTRGVPKPILEKLRLEMRRPDSYSTLAIRDLTLDLLAWVKNCPLKIRLDAVQQIARLLDEGSSASFSVEKVSSDLDKCPITLLRSFRARYGCSPAQFARRSRIQRSVKLLREGRGLGEIAIESGFYDQSHFTNAFRHETGMTPQRFREQLND